uniref:Wax synthase domain-containing protein n=1 Tax=Kalanchoe fedtschenkoi TaxID=63787 RepID=A0A7N0U0F3_KALFE
MEPDSSEIIRFVQTWLIVCLSLTYCFLAGKLVSPGKVRFLLISPVVVLFLLLPLRLTSVHLGGATAFFISWLATFKLVLFSFNRGPLSSDPSISLPRFLAAASLPIKISPKSDLGSAPGATSAAENDPRRPIWKLARGFAVKAALVAMLFKLYDYKARLHPTAVWLMYCFHIYFMSVFILAVAGAAARAGLGLELEPQFNEPYFATSLGDFWGRRWNLVVTSILRPTVYQPVLSLLSGPMGRLKAQSFAVLATFTVSGIMHELIMYNLNRFIPTGEMAAFFLLHGVCVVAETALMRRMNGKWRVPKILMSCLTIWFVLSTAFWLFLSEFLRGKVEIRAFEEYAALGEFLESVANGTLFRSFDGSASIQKLFKNIISF